MNGKLFFVAVSCGQYNGSNEPDVRTVAVCTHGVHVKYTMATLFSNSNDLLFANMGKIECETCDGSCRRRYDMRRNQPDSKEMWREHVALLRSHSDFQPEPMQRAVSHTIFSDGDSGCTVHCHGTYHVVEVCQEFGMGWYPEQVKACDCHLRSNVILPEVVAKLVKSFLSQRAKLQNKKALTPTFFSLASA